MSGMITHRRDPVTALCQPVEWSRRALALGGGRPPVTLSARANLLHKTAFTTWTGVRACEKACTLNNRVRKPKPEISKTTDSVSHSVVWLFVTPMDCSPQGSSVSEILQARIYWSGLPFPSLGYLSNPGIKPRSPTLQAASLPSESPGKPQRTILKKRFLKQICSKEKIIHCLFICRMEAQQCLRVSGYDY